MMHRAARMMAVAIGVACTTALPALGGGKSSSDRGGDAPTWIATYSGADFAKDSFYTYSGAVVSLQRDLSRSGFVFQGFAGYGSYEYASTVPGGVVDGDVRQLAALFGYLWIRPGAALGIYLGADYHDHDLTPDDLTNRVRGDEVGFRVGADARFIGPRHYVSLEGYYSTAFETYWSRARAGLNFGHFVLGPEAAAHGNEGYDARRIGGFTMVKLDMFGMRNPAELTVNAGYQFLLDADDPFVSSSGGGEGAYIGFNLGFAF